MTRCRSPPCRHPLTVLVLVLVARCLWMSHRRRRADFAVSVYDDGPVAADADANGGRAQPLTTSRSADDGGSDGPEGGGGGGRIFDRRWVGGAAATRGDIYATRVPFVSTQLHSNTDMLAQSSLPSHHSNGGNGDPTLFGRLFGNGHRNHRNHNGANRNGSSRALLDGGHGGAAITSTYAAAAAATQAPPAADGVVAAPICGTGTSVALPATAPGGLLRGPDGIRLGGLLGRGAFGSVFEGELARVCTGVRAVQQQS